MPDNIDQRIEQDVREFITSTVQIVRGVINSVLTTIEFTIILWSLSGVLTLFGFNIEKGVVFFIYAFIIFATLMSVWIGRPLIKLNLITGKRFYHPVNFKEWRLFVFYSQNQMSYFSMKQLQHWMKQRSIYSTKQLKSVCPK